MSRNQIRTPLRLLEVLAQGYREVVEETDAIAGKPVGDYARGYRDGIQFVTKSLEKLILAVREGELES